MKGGLGPGVGIAIGLSGKATAAIPGVMSANRGLFHVNGQDATLTVATRTMAATHGSFTLTGEPATLIYSGEPLPYLPVLF